MNAKPQTSLMLAAVWVGGIALPVSFAGAAAAPNGRQLDFAINLIGQPQEMHGNNPKYGIEDDTERPPKPPQASPAPTVFRLLAMPGIRSLSNGASELSGISDLQSDADSAASGPIEVDALPDPTGGLRSLLDIAGPSPYAGSQWLDLLSFSPDQASGAPLLPGARLAGAVPGPGALAILGLAAAFAGRRRRRND